MKKIITNDGSITYRNELLDECYHTKSGAEEEARKKFVKPLNPKENTVVYDICFGLGYNTAAFLEKIKKTTIHCFEDDKEILKKILELKTSFKTYPIIKNFIANFLKGKNEFQKEKIKLIMHFGDVKKEIKKINEKVDYVLFDPFSPKKAPEMWSEELFSDICNRMNQKGQLTTYSCAKKIREAMKKAGLKIKDGPVIGRRSPSTIAWKNSVKN